MLRTYGFHGGIVVSLTCTVGIFMNSYQIQVTRYQIPVAGYQVAGTQVLQSSVAYGLWTMDYGL